MDWRPAWRIAAIGFALHLAMCAITLAATRGDVTEFVHFGRQAMQLPLAKKLLGPDVQTPNKDGHDGTLFWVLAHDPLLVHPPFLEKYLDRPVYRAQRVLYPLLVSPWRLAGERALVWGMLATNLAVVALGGLVTARLAQLSGLPARGGLMFALNPGVFLAVGMSLSDALMLLGIVASLLFLTMGKPGWAVIGAIVTGLAKEPGLLAIAAIAALAPGLRLRARAALLGVPVMIVGLWGLYVRFRFGWGSTGVVELAPPFVGLAGVWRWWAASGEELDSALVASSLMVLSVVVVVQYWRRRTLLLGAALPYALLMPFLSFQVLSLLTNSLRAFAPAMTLLFVDALGSRDHRGRVVPAP